MADLIPKDTDEEMDRYTEAEMVKRANITLENNAALSFEADPVTGRENAYFPLSAGGFVKIGERAVTPEQAADTDELAVTDAVQNSGMGSIAEFEATTRQFQGYATMDDFATAGFTEDQVREFYLRKKTEELQQPGERGIPVQLTPEQIQYGMDVGAPMVMPRATTARDRVQDIAYAGLSQFIDDPNDLRFWSDYLTDVADIAVPGVGGAITTDEGARLFNQGVEQGNAVDMLFGAALTTLGVAELVPLVKGLTGPARKALEENLSPAAKNLLADTIGASRAIAQGDKDMLLEIFQPAGTPRSLGAAAPEASDLQVTRRDASNIFGEGSERVRYTDPQSGGTIEVVVRPDGSASVLELEVPQEFRGQGIGQNLQERVMRDFPMMGGQVSSKAAATTAYRLGRRPAGKPDATLEDVFAEIDDMSSVNMVSPEMQRSLGAAAPEGAKIKPQMGEAFDDWIDRIYAPENRGPQNVVQDENVVFRAMSPQEAEAGEGAGVFRDLSGQPLYVANDPERYIGGGAYGGKRQGRIYEFDVTGLASEVRQGGVGIQERAISEIPTDRVRRVWEWNPETKAHELIIDNTQPRSLGAAAPEGNIGKEILEMQMRANPAISKMFDDAGVTVDSPIADIEGVLQRVVRSDRMDKRNADAIIKRMKGE